MDDHRGGLRILAQNLIINILDKFFDKNFDRIGFAAIG